MFLKHILRILFSISLAITVTACHVVKLDAQGNPILPVDPKAQLSFDNMSPSDITNKIWPKLFAEAQTKAIDLNTAMQLNHSDTYHVFVKFDGKVTAYQPTGLKRLLTVSTNVGDIQLNFGPMILSNAIRDASSIISFDDVKNQVQFARLSKAINKKAIHNITIPETSWVNSPIHVVAAVSINNHKILAAIPLIIDRRQ
ncbi:DUF2291 family protein [Celerinatantimonas yamalensis]|uniref:DUF2291 family protein n=1 Tax=Celerinatantimonas yamalensis TaxID=559956 RepID=A0ABW9G6U4_9GAMM